jgi:hypothetical protein
MVGIYDGTCEIDGTDVGTKLMIGEGVTSKVTPRNIGAASPSEKVTKATKERKLSLR